MRSLLKDFLKFVRQEKKWWIISLLVILLLLGLVLFLTSGSGIAWSMYSR